MDGATWRARKGHQQLRWKARGSDLGAGCEISADISANISARCHLRGDECRGDRLALARARVARVAYAHVPAK